MTAQVCREQVHDGGGWHSWQCRNPAKYIVRRGGDRSFSAKDGEDLPVCGIHVRWFRKHASELRIDEVPK